jgi:ribosomal protein S18 acetylase RimI-like enzyme
MIFLVENNERERVEQIRVLYESAFPPDERMPFERVLQKRDAGTMTLLSIENADGEFLGFANITLCFDVLALNYFAILPEHRGKGFGTEVIVELKKRHPDRSIVIDIEDDDVDSDNAEQRKRRRAFYERLGFCAMPYRLLIFGVPSIIMSSGRSYTFEEYTEIFAQVFSRWALSRIEQIK